MSVSIAPKSDSRLIRKVFLKLLPVQILLLALNCLNAIIDGIIASNCLGAEAMDAIGLYTPVVLCCLAFSGTLAGGSQVLMGRYMGAADSDGTNGVYALSIILTVVFGLPLMIISLAASGGLASVLGASAEIKTAVSSYIEGLGFGVLPMVLTPQLSIFLQIERQDRINYAGMTVIFALNFILNLVFINVYGMGIFGLGLATSVSNWVYLVILLWYFLLGRSTLKFSLSSIKWSESRDIFVIGFPGALVLLCAAVRNILLNRYLTAYTDLECLAVFATFCLLINALYAVPNGVRNICRMLCSICIGEDDRNSLMLTVKTSLRWGTLIVMVEAVFCFVFSGVISRIYYSDPGSGLYRMTKHSIQVYSLWLFFFIIGAVFAGYYQAMERMKYSALAACIEGAAIVCPVSVLAVPVIGLNGVWLGFFLGTVVSALLPFVYAILCNKGIPGNTYEWLTIPPDFGSSDEERMEFSIRSLEEVITTAERVQTFCIGLGLDKKRSYDAALCLEEMAANIVLHGFSSDRKSHSIDILVVKREDGAMLRIRDDCIPFNIKEYFDLINPEDITKNIGIRLTIKKAREVSYQNLLGLNVLMLTF